MIHHLSERLCICERAGERLIPHAEQKNMNLGGVRQRAGSVKELEEPCFFGFLSLVEQSAWGQRKGRGQENEAGRWKVSKNVQEFQEQVASGDMKEERDKCNRRALEKRPQVEWWHSISLFCPGASYPPLVPLHTLAQAAISALSRSLPRMVHDVDDKCAIPIHCTDKKASSTSVR